MFPLTPLSSAAAKTVFRRSAAWASSIDPPSQIASNMPDHADHAGRLPARGFLPRRLSDAGPSALASASVPGRRPKPLTIPAVHS